VQAACGGIHAAGAGYAVENGEMVKVHRRRFIDQKENAGILSMYL
jgi:hypothetical protein